jgi:hypothetical protein
MIIASEKVSTVRVEAGESVSIKFQAVLRRNYGFSVFINVNQVLNGDDIDPPEDIAPEKIPLLKYAPMTSFDVERSFQPTNTLSQVKDNE